MTRFPIPAALLVLAACRGAGETAEAIPAGTVVLDRPSGGGSLFDPSPSPDGTRLMWAEAVEGRSAIFVANADGSDPVRITHGIWDRNPVWSPDGRWIAYLGEAPDFDIFVVPTEGGEPRQLTSGPAIDETRMWLPDGSGVVFLRYGSQGARTLVVPLEGGEPYPLVPPREGNNFVTPSPDGSRAAFTLIRGAESTIWIQDMGGGEARQLTTEGLEQGSELMWSPDGRSVVYESRRTGTWDLWVADLETGEHRQLTTDVNDDQFGVWSPDGGRIAFRSTRGGQTDVWIVPAAGGQPRRITDDLAEELFIRWATDGSLSFLSTDVDGSLRVAATDGSGSRELFHWQGYEISEPALSPDGRTVLFESNRSGNADVWSVPFDGGEPVPFVASPLADGMPRFSPDGRHVVFVSGRSGSLDLWVVPASGGEVARLTSWPSTEVAPGWSPDGSSIAFASDHESDTPELWVVPVAGGEAAPLRPSDDPRRLSSELWAPGPEAVSFDWSPDGAAIYFPAVAAAGGRDVFRASLSGGDVEGLGVHRGVASGALSPDGAHYAYVVIDGGLSWIEVVSTGGGPPRRLSPRTDSIFQPDVDWRPDGSGLVVLDYDYAADTYDLVRVSWPDGVWRPLTATSDATESLGPFTSDGAGLVTTSTSLRRRIVSVPASELAATGIGEGQGGDGP